MAPKPVYAKSANRREIWPMVVEKAFAKLHGTYEAIGGGGRIAAALRSEVNSELNFSPNFEGLVLGCIDADFCK